VSSTRQAGRPPRLDDLAFAPSGLRLFDFVGAIGFDG